MPQTAEIMFLPTIDQFQSDPNLPSVSKNQFRLWRMQQMCVRRYVRGTSRGQTIHAPVFPYVIRMGKCLHFMAECLRRQSQLTMTTTNVVHVPFLLSAVRLFGSVLQIIAHFQL